MIPVAVFYIFTMKTDFLYKLTFCQTLEKNRNLTVFGYYVESDDSLLAWPTVESNYGTGEDDFWDYGIDHYVVKVDTVSKFISCLPDIITRIIPIITTTAIPA